VYFKLLLNRFAVGDIARMSDENKPMAEQKAFLEEYKAIR
jgi:hypothetical protein